MNNGRPYERGRIEPWVVRLVAALIAIVVLFVAFPDIMAGIFITCGVVGGIVAIALVRW